MSSVSVLPAAAPAAGTVRPGLALLALAMGGFAIGTAEFATMSLLPAFAEGLGIDEPAAGHVISAYALGVVTGAPLIAVFGARQPRWLLLVALMAFFAVANALSALAPSYGWMLAFRFLSGLPHGAYFGVAALVAASLVPANRRASAIARVMLGLTVATIVGVPLANGIGQAFGWRWGFAVVAVVALATVVLVLAFAPRDLPRRDASPLTELGTLRNRQVWLTLGIGAVGFGGIFAVYTYLASTLMAVTQVPATTVPIVLSVFGVGITVGTLVCGWAGDRALMPTVGGALVFGALVMGAFPFVAGNLAAVSVCTFLIGAAAGFGTPLQTRLMDVAGEAQTLAAALHHSAFNFANALGPWLAGLAIAAGHGWTSIGWVGAGLSLGGLAVWALALADDRLRRDMAAA